jgi:hypothetical protein
LWSFTVTDSISSEIARLADARAALVQQMDTLNSIASDYFIANQQGDLIFLLSQQGNANEEVAGLVYQGNILDRATPVRNMIAALATAGLVDYQQTYDTYEQLNDAARENLTFENYIAVKQAEQEIIATGQERVPVLLNDIFELDKAINAKQAEQSRNRIIGLIAAILGSALLLGANLLAERGKAVKETGD